MDVGSKQAVGELHQRITQVDDTVAGQWLDVAPFGVFARREYLKPAEPVEEHSDAPEISVLRESKMLITCGLRRSFDQTDLIAAPMVEPMHVRQGRRWKFQVFVQKIENQRYDRIGAKDEGLECGSFLRDHIWFRQRVYDPEEIHSCDLRSSDEVHHQLL